jgi:hypothetical protein
MRESATGSRRIRAAGGRAADPGRPSRRYSWCIVGGALLPLTAALATIVTLLEPSAWLSPADGWQGLAPASLLFSTGLLLVAAPLAGVAVASQARAAAPRGGWAATGTTCVVLLLGAFVWTTAAAGLTGVVAMASGDGLSTPLFAAHLVQGATALALAFVGALAAAWLREPLDAAALSLGLAISGSLGILAAGVMVERLPDTILGWAVAANPLLAISSAAQIDVMHTDWLYQISPLAHVQLQVPDWPAAIALYVLVASACAAALPHVYARTGSEPTFHQP